jgi:putative flippase GtrA
MISRTPRLIELRNYFLVSCCALLADVSVLLLLTQQFAIRYLIASTVSFVVGGMLAYQLSIRFVFPGHEADGVRYNDQALFILLGIIGLAINGLVMTLAIEFAHAPLLVAKGAAAGCTFFGNYWTRRRWVFSRQTLA